MNETVRENRTNLGIAQSVQQCLVDLDEKLVMAESCTGGELASTLTRLPGISKNLCGSFVTYRPSAKLKWLGVQPRTINRYTAESEECVREMALGAIQTMPEASWSIAVVGHLGPDAPKDDDGMIYICIVRRTAKGNIKIKKELSHKLEVVLGGDSPEARIAGRALRQRMATEICLTHLARLLTMRHSRHMSDQEQAKKRKVVV